MLHQIAIIGIHEDAACAAPIEYTLGLIITTCGADYRIMPLDQFKTGKYSLPRTLFISYGKYRPDIGAKKQIYIYASDLFGNDYHKSASMVYHMLGSIDQQVTNGYYQKEY